MTDPIVTFAALLFIAIVAITFVLRINSGVRYATNDEFGLGSIVFFIFMAILIIHRYAS